MLLLSAEASFNPRPFREFASKHLPQRLIFCRPPLEHKDVDIPYFVQKKIGNHYLLLMGEGGSDYNHAVTALTAKSLWGPYIPCSVNPVLTHRHLGKDYPVQSLGHADLVQTPTRDWYAVFLGKRDRGRRAGAFRDAKPFFVR